VELAFGIEFGCMPTQTTVIGGCASPIVAYTPSGVEDVIAEGVDVSDFAVSARVEVFFTDCLAHRIWFIDVQGNKRAAYTGYAACAPSCKSHQASAAAIC
jgi:hypothetical protein